MRRWPEPTPGPSGGGELGAAFPSTGGVAACRRLHVDEVGAGLPSFGSLTGRDRSLRRALKRAAETPIPVVSMVLQMPLVPR